VPAATRPLVLLPNLPPRGLSRAEAAGYVGVSPTTFDAMVSERIIPRPGRYRRRLLWDRHQIDRALDAFFNEPTARARAIPEFAL
jgi:hypothetical protein